MELQRKQDVGGGSTLREWVQLVDDLVELFLWYAGFDEFAQLQRQTENNR